jgi:hypothetical protein
MPRPSEKQANLLIQQHELELLLGLRHLIGTTRGLRASASLTTDNLVQGKKLEAASERVHSEQ